MTRIGVPRVTISVRTACTSRVARSALASSLLASAPALAQEPAGRVVGAAASIAGFVAYAQD